MRKFSLLAVLLNFIPINSFAQSTGKVGYKYAGLAIDPKCGSLENGDFQPDSSPEMDKAHIFTSYGKCGHSNVIWLSKIISGDVQSGQKVVLDRVDVRTLAKNEKFVGSGTYCYLKGKKEDRLVFPAIFQGWDRKKPMTRKSGILRDGWLINAKTDKIEKTKTSDLDKVECLDESGGED